MFSCALRAALLRLVICAPCCTDEVLRRACASRWRMAFSCAEALPRGGAAWLVPWAERC
jgi:hypothetical protein